jgi:hypothetical protein
MAAIQLGHPVLFLIEMKTNDLAFQLNPHPPEKSTKKTGRGKPLPVELQS